MTRSFAAGTAVLLTAFAAAAQPPAAPLPAPTTQGEDPAVTAFKAGRFDDALKELQASGRANPKLAPARVRLAELFSRSGQPAAARSQIEQAAAEDPTHPAVLLANAAFAFADGRVLDTVLSCRAALALADSPRWDADQKQAYVREARNGLAAAFEARGDWPAVKEQMTALLNDRPKDAAARGRLATATFWLGGPEQAFAEFQTVARDDPTQELPELRMARLWTAKGDTAKAEEWHKKAVTAHPANAAGPRAYAAFLLNAGRPDAAAVYVETAAKLDPKHREAVVLRGLLARYKKDLPAAEAVFEAMAKDHPEDPFAAWNLALVLADGSDPAKHKRAVTLAEAEVRRNPQLTEGYAVLGWCYYRDGRADEADKALDQAAGAGRVPADTAYYLAKRLADKGRAADAQLLLRPAVTVHGPFVNRADAVRLLADLDKTHPPKK